MLLLLMTDASNIDQLHSRQIIHPNTLKYQVPQSRLSSLAFLCVTEYRRKPTYTLAEYVSLKNYFCILICMPANPLSP
jgi:hypothetical protein